MRTLSIKKNEIENKWYLVDAENKTLGRLSSKIASVLRGKNKVNYTPHLDMSDYIIVINADKINLTGKKSSDKEYWNHSGYPGGGKTQSVKTSTSEFILYNAIKGMLPHNSLGRKLIKHLKIYKDSVHPHDSQCPELMEL